MKINHIIFYGIIIFLFQTTAFANGNWIRCHTFSNSLHCHDIYSCKTDPNVFVAVNLEILPDTILQKRGYTYWKTNDYGLTWDSIYSTVKNVTEMFEYDNPSFVHILDSNTIYLTHIIDKVEHTLFIRTTDGGTSWDTLNKPANWTSYFYFKDINNGYIINAVRDTAEYHSFSIFHTSDGGSSWTEKLLPSLPLLDTIQGYLNYCYRGNDSLIFFMKVHRQLTPDFAYTGKYLRYFFLSNDFGLSWKLIKDSVPDTYLSSGASCIDNDIYVHGADPTNKPNSFLRKSSDMGATWESIDLTGLDLKYHFTNIYKWQDTLIYHSWGGLTKSTDCGKSWNSMNDGLDEWVNRSLTRMSTPNKGLIAYNNYLFRYELNTSIKEDITNNYISIYPNPCNTSSKIAYSVNNAGFVNIAVYDMLGNEVAILINDYQSAGAYEAIFNAEALSTGVYFITINTAGTMETKKIIVAR